VLELRAQLCGTPADTRRVAGSPSPASQLFREYFRPLPSVCNGGNRTASVRLCIHIWLVIFVRRCNGAIRIRSAWEFALVYQRKRERERERKRGRNGITRHTTRVLYLDCPLNLTSDMMNNSFIFKNAMRQSQCHKHRG